MLRSVDPLPRMGARVGLRRLRADDLAAFQAYRADPEVGRFQGWSPMPLPAATAFLAGMNTASFGVAGEWFQLGIAEGATDRLIGDIGFCVCGPDNQHAELGFSLSREFQGQGMATEAVREMIDLLFARTVIARVVAMTDERNQPCIRLLQRVGMIRVSQVNSVLRGECFIEQVYVRQRHA
jgi:RimJ/RimL family protein N-acetyltransferase